MFMKIISLNQNSTLLNQFLSEIRNIDVQGGRLRFRRNMERVGEIMAYEISRTLPYHPVSIQTPLATAVENVPAEQPVVATILRAGLPLHQGFINYFDHAENAFVSAYRKYINEDNFDIHIAYSRQAIEHIKKVFPAEKTTVWCGAIDPELNAHSYIVPGLGDAGDLCYGEKE